MLTLPFYGTNILASTLAASSGMSVNRFEESAGIGWADQEVDLL